MKFSEIANRLTGFSTPIFGVQWTPAKLDQDVAREVIVFLEDRGALYVPYEAEVPEFVVRSVLEIRAFLTDVLRRGGIADELAEALKAMRVACRRFVRSVNTGEGQELIVPTPSDMFDGGTVSWAFNQSLGELRGVFGVHIAQIAVRYGIDIPDELASILPLSPEGDGDQ